MLLKNVEKHLIEISKQNNGRQLTVTPKRMIHLSASYFPLVISFSDNDRNIVQNPISPLPFINEPIKGIW